MSDELVGVLRLEKRTAKRYRTGLEVLFVLRGELTRTTAVDVSMTGMKLRGEVDLEVGTILQAHFALPGSVVTHQVTGKIVWAKAAADIVGLYEAGLEFSSFSEGANLELSNLIKGLSGDADLDDLPMVEEEHVHDVVEPVAADRPGRAPTPAPAPAPAVPASGDVNDPWLVSQRLSRAVAEDVRRREEDSQRAKQLVASARQAQEERDGRRAIELLTEAVKLVPDSPDLAEELAAALYVAGDVRASAQLFDKALRLRQERGG